MRDIELNRLADAFIKYEMLDLSPGAARFQQKLLEDSGLGDETAETILELKGVIAEYQKKKAAEEGGQGGGRRRR